MLKQPNFRGSEAMGTSSSRSKKDNEKECISSEHGRLGWTELVTSTSSRVLREFPDCRKPENSPASCYTLERQTDDPDSPVTFLSIAFEELTSLPIQEIPDQLFNTVQSLDLSNNRFRDVQFLSEFESLASVNLDHNRLECLTAFPRLPRLRSLSLNFNRILSLHPFVTSLATQCPRLIFLSMMGNELCPNYLNGGTEQQNELYRLYVIRHFPNLRYVDDGPVSPIERERAIASSNTHSSLSAQLGHSSLGSVDEGIDTE
ncbi:leucine-rich melanocyte differentiation-associated protein-like isoform X2 [Varroa jacobsoni]|nr:leucine-rich melanocyte differentiation-associated protein-like isoform X2 [Varroa jacobsoni]